MMAHTFTGLRAPYLPILWVGSIFCAWNYLSLGSFSLAGCITIISVVFFSVLLGNLFWIAALKRSAQFDYLSFKLLIGILLGNCLLFVISLAMPFGLIWDWILLIGLIALATLVLKVPVRSIFATNSNPEKILLLVLPLITANERIQFFIAEPGALNQWNLFYPDSIVYECKGYRLFRFQ